MSKSTDGKMDISELLEELMDTSREAWDQIIDGGEVDKKSLDAASDAASSLAVQYAEIAEYLGQRGGYSAGDHGHEAAMKQAAKRVKKVRRALGYSYP